MILFVLKNIVKGFIEHGKLEIRNSFCPIIFFFFLFDEIEYVYPEKKKQK